MLDKPSTEDVTDESTDTLAKIMKVLLALVIFSIFFLVGAVSYVMFYKDEAFDPLGLGISGSCEYEGYEYSNGEGVEVDDCNSCICSNGEVQCTLMDCGDTPSLEGKVDNLNNSEVEEDPPTDDTSEDMVLEDNDNYDSQDPVSFKYTLDTVAVSYDPDANYIGFQSCDSQNSTCSIYAVLESDVPDVTLGQEYRLSFDTFQNEGVALGTSYNKVTGIYEIESF